MTNLRFINRVARRWSWCLAGWVAVSALAQEQNSYTWIQPQEEYWWRHFRVGALVGLNLKAEFSMSGQFGISGSQPGATGVPGVNHFYDDGYVRVDDTGNAQGYTSFWGYENGSQYDQANTLTFHSASSFSLRGGSSTVDDGPQLGVDMAYGGDFTRWGRALVGWELGFSLLPIGITDSRPLATVTTRTVHTFDTAGIVVPTAPYNGGSSGIGPTIHDVATAPLPDGDTIAGTITGSRKLDVNLYSIRLGPTLQWELHPRWVVGASAGAALGIISGNYKFNEQLVLVDGSSTSNRGSIDASDVVYGVYASAVVLFHASEKGDVYVGAQFMSLGDTTVKSGGREAQLQLGQGVYLSAGVNWPF